MTSRKRIPAEEQVPFRRWEMPDLTGIKRSIARRLDELEAQTSASEQEEAPTLPQLPTAEEVEALRAEAEQAGFQAGQQAGHAEGYEAGRALGYQEGEAQGQEAGFQVGYQRGLEEAQHEIDAQLARLASLIQQLQGPIQELDFEVEEALLGLVDQLCRALIRREVALDRDYLRDIIKESIAALPPGYQRLNIHFHPDDLPLVEAACASLLDRYQLTPNASITPGGVELETRQSLVDATLEQRYKKLVGQLVAGQYQQRLGEMESLADEQLDTPSVPEASFSSDSSEAEAAPASPRPPVSETAPLSGDLSTVEPSVDATAPLEAHALDEQNQKDSGIEASRSAAPLEVPASEAAEMAETPPVPAVSRVSLQRQSAPRQPVPAAAPETEDTASDAASQAEPLVSSDEASQDEFSDLAPSASEPQLSEPLASEPQIATSAPEQDLSQAEMQDVNAPTASLESADSAATEDLSQAAAPIDQDPEVAASPEATSHLDDLSEDEFFAQALQALDSDMELADEDIDAELDGLLSSVQQQEADESTSEVDQDPSSNETAQTDKASDSVHEGRYLQEGQQDAWADDFLSDLDEPLEDLTPKSQGPVSG